MQDNSVCSFAPATLAEKFLPKKFKSDKDYRAATVEAVRLAMLKGVAFDDTFMQQINSCQQVSYLRSICTQMFCFANLVCLCC